MPLLFRSPGIPLRVHELLARVRPERALRELLRGERVRFALSAGAGQPLTPGPPIRDAQLALPAGAALWLDDEARAESPFPDDAREAEAWLPALPWPAGVVPTAAGCFRFEVVASEGDRSRVRFALEGATAAELRAWCEQAGAPLVGDLAHGGSLALPDEPLFAHEGALRISQAAERALLHGHPWLTRDRESEDDGRFAPGALVELRGEGGRPVALARIEGAPVLVARVWHRLASPRVHSARGLPMPAKPASIEARVAAALARRAKLRASGASDALRLVHGEADALPGWFADRLGPLIRVLVAGRAALPLSERAIATLTHALAEELGGGEPSVVVVHQLRPQPRGELVCVRLVAGPPPPEPLIVREAGLAFRVESGLAEPARPHPGVGLFLDQRANRARIAERVRPGGRYLNLFAHTGAFSAALLAAGASEVVSVDLSGPYLALLEQNLERSGLACERHRAVRREVRRYLAELPEGERFDGIVLDPPTAASAGRSFWSARQGMESLVGDCLRRLAPQGFLLASSNDRQARGKLRARVEAALAASEIGPARLEDARPSEDFPALAGFPEGTPFEAVLVQRR
jgi:23S rRNA (cytosine1962-C5)-methyltransferase